MTQNEIQLWERIVTFELDEQAATLTFSQRLARENGWGASYTNRVIEEYRKFLFLCCTGETQITPSDPVDQAWHLHLTYTRSYWNDLCRNTLQKEIHHNPTKGGKQEQVKFDDCYTTSQAAYKEKFGEDPPADIWHDNETRFSDIHFRRVNLGRYWTIPKPKSMFIFQLMAIGAFIGFAILVDLPQGVAIFFSILFLLATVRRHQNGRRAANGNSGCSAGIWFGGSTGSENGHNGWGDDSGCAGDTGCSGCGGGCGGD